VRTELAEGGHKLAFAANGDQQGSVVIDIRAQSPGRKRFAISVDGEAPPILNIGFAVRSPWKPLSAASPSIEKDAKPQFAKKQSGGDSDGVASTKPTVITESEDATVHRLPPKKDER